MNVKKFLSYGTYGNYDVVSAHPSSVWNIFWGGEMLTYFTKTKTNSKSENRKFVGGPSLKVLVN